MPLKVPALGLSGLMTSAMWVLAGICLHNKS